MKVSLILLAMLLSLSVHAQRHDWTLVGRDFAFNQGFLVDSFSTEPRAVVLDVLPYGSDTTFGAFVYTRASNPLNVRLSGIAMLTSNGTVKKVIRNVPKDSVWALFRSSIVPGSMAVQLRFPDTDSTYIYLRQVAPFDNSSLDQCLFQRRLKRNFFLLDSFDISRVRLRILDAYMFGREVAFIRSFDSLVNANSSQLFVQYNKISRNLGVSYTTNLNYHNSFGHLDSTRLYTALTLSPSVDRSSFVFAYRLVNNMDSIYLFEAGYDYLKSGRKAKFYSNVSSYNRVLYASFGAGRSSTNQNLPLTHYFENRYLLGRIVRINPDSSAVSILDKNLDHLYDVKFKGNLLFVKPLQSRNIFVTYSIKRKGYQFNTPDSLFYASIFDTLGNELFRHEIYEANMGLLPANYGFANYPVAYTEDHKGGLFITCYAHTSTIVHLSNIGKFYHDTVRTGPVVSLASNISTGTFKYYPNPADNSLTITSGASADFPQSALIIDMLGRKVAEYPLKHDRSIVDISAVPQGVYRLRIGKEAKTLVIKH